MRSYYPRELPPGFGLVRVRSPLLTESIFLSLPPGTEMFQFPGLARVLPDQSPFDGSPELIAVFHALEPPGAQTSPTRPYELGRTAPHPHPLRLCIANPPAVPARGDEGPGQLLTILLFKPSKARVST